VTAECEACPRRACVVGPDSAGNALLALLCRVQIEVRRDVPEPAELAEARRVYLAAFSEAPYAEGAAEADEFITRVRRYAAERAGFRLLLARLDEDRIVGLALTVLGVPGNWWRDQVASHLGPAATERWLADRCVEVVHVAVDPRQRRQGIGRALMTAVEQDADAERGVLGCHPDALPAQRLYLGAGWELITTDFRIAGGPPSWLLGRHW
jgi:ribosomal protein S18 acetylase RimI-like enzyme